MLASFDEAFRMYPPGVVIEISGYEMAPGVSAVCSTVASILLPVAVPHTYSPIRP